MIQAGVLKSNQDQIIVYALSSTTRKYIYVGMTNNLDRRVDEHNLGKEKTTKPYKPFSLIHSKSFPSRKEARVYEKYLKTGLGKQYLRGLK